jgi:hypothetical protein
MSDSVIVCLIRVQHDTYKVMITDLTTYSRVIYNDQVVISAGYRQAAVADIIRAIVIFHARERNELDDNGYIETTDLDFYHGLMNLYRVVL